MPHAVLVAGASSSSHRSHEERQQGIPLASLNIALASATAGRQPSSHASNMIVCKQPCSSSTVFQGSAGFILDLHLRAHVLLLGCMPCVVLDRVTCVHACTAAQGCACAGWAPERLGRGLWGCQRWGDMSTAAGHSTSDVVCWDSFGKHGTAAASISSVCHWHQQLHQRYCYCYMVQDLA